MKKLEAFKRPCYAMFFAALAALIDPGLAFGQSGGNYSLGWYSINNGPVERPASAGYTLTSVTGQPDAGPLLSGGGYTLTGGFLQPALVHDPASAVAKWSLY